MKKYLVTALFAVGATLLGQTSNNKYEVTFFGGPPAGQDVWGLPRSVAADGKGTVVIFRARLDPPVLIFNRDGQLKQTWGNGLFPDAHSVDFDREGFLWFTDRNGHMVYKFTKDGKQLLALGKKGVPGDNKSTDAFNGPSDVAVARNGDVFVSDGDFNSRVVHLSKDGKFISIIGGMRGGAPGQFDRPHAVAFDSKDRLLVLDQQPDAHNPRVQIFDQNGKFLEQWTNIGLKLPTGLTIGPDDTVYIGDTDANAITVLKDGKVIDVIGMLQARPHNIAIDPPTGVLYLVDPDTPVYAGNTNPNPRGGSIKQIIKKIRS
jgi:hypothetical protein